MKRCFDFYGISIEIESSELEFQSVLENVSLDFHYFRSLKPAQEPIEIHLSREAPAKIRSTPQPLFPLFRTRLCKAWGWRERICDYGLNHGIFLSSKTQLFVYGTDPDLVYEMLYILLLSRVGEELEIQKKWLRMHAVAFNQDGDSTVILLPSGGGKSVLASQVLQDSNAKLFGDEMIFTDGEKLYPFPIRLALKEEVLDWVSFKSLRPFKRKVFDTKYLLTLPDVKVAAPSKLTGILIGKKNSRTALHRLSFLETVSFLCAQVLGLGLPQMRELMIRSDNWSQLPALAFQRFKLSLKLLSNIPSKSLSTCHTDQGRSELLKLLNLKPRAAQTSKEPLEASI